MTDAIAALEDPSPEMVEDLATLLLNSAHAASGPLVRAHDICQHLGDYLRNEAGSAAASANPSAQKIPKPTTEQAAYFRDLADRHVSYDLAQEDQEPSAEAVSLAEKWFKWPGYAFMDGRVAEDIDAFAARKVVEAVAAERARIEKERADENRA